jgi:hypothetical protein
MMTKTRETFSLEFKCSIVVLFNKKNNPSITTFLDTLDYKALGQQKGYLIFSSFTRRDINICIMQTLEQLRFLAWGTIITRGCAKLMGKILIMLNKVLNKNTLIARRKSETMERYYITLAARRADAAIQ